jgi:pimeloyl-ACP methyl ester carboxylesterase
MGSGASGGPPSGQVASLDRGRCASPGGRARIRPYLDFAEREFAVAPHFATYFLGAFEEVRHRFWPVKARGAFYGPFRNPPSAPPALVLHTTHDPATPYAWGKRVVRQLGNARLLTVRGDGHGILTQFNACALAAVIPYLNDTTLPPKGATCEQDIPFAASTARAATTTASIP